MNKLFDTHAHYFDEKFNELEGGADALLSSEKFKNIVGAVITVGADPKNPTVSVDMAKKYDFMYAAVGIHPEDAQKKCVRSPDEEIAAIEALVADDETCRANKIVAIGEIGFDYYWQPVDKELQYEYFSKQMTLAEKYALPVIVHDRDAHADTFEMICRYPKVKGVLHSCSMSAEMVKEIVKRGWYISFSGTVTFKNAERVREACGAVPLYRLLIETDAPYLAPVPYRGKLNHSILMQETCAVVAQVHRIGSDEMAKITYENACRLFKIK
jgi:TatD DNase family protein